MSGTGKTIRSVITPNDQFLRDVFKVSKAYLIDIYQRAYKWDKKNVETLLSDIEAHFEQHTRTKIVPKEIQAEVQERFEPYFLNTYLTHSTATNIAIVDGQQRLTTLLLMLIKLRDILNKIESLGCAAGQTFSSQTLEDLILERNDFGEASRFKIFNENREEAFRSLLDGNEFSAKDETQKRIRENMVTISNHYERLFATGDDALPYDTVKLTYYITYLLDRISIVEIKIENQQNVAMIFEVVNDRGLGLKPYEILKGKLIGNLKPEQKEDANKIWTDLDSSYFNAVIKNSSDASLDLDSFFRTFFRAKFANSENDYEKFEGDYHYAIYTDERIKKYFGDFKDNDHLYKIIVEDVNYFARLYLKLRTSYDNEFLVFNKLLDQNYQYLLIMSNIKYLDKDEARKINDVAKKFDQFHCVMRFVGNYISNSFQRMIFPLNRGIRETDSNTARSVFDRELIRQLEQDEIVEKGTIKAVSDIFTWQKFKGVMNNWTNFTKYVLMRIDRHLADILDKPSYASGDLEELEDHFNKSTRKKHGMHLEHIYAYNDVNKLLFTNSQGDFNEQEFQNTRNFLGMVLLLKDRQNWSSGAETYAKKIDRYAKSNFIWNELLVGHMDPVDFARIPSHLKVNKIDPDQDGAFPLNKVDERQQAVFSFIKEIWDYE